MAQELLNPFDLSGKLVLADKGYDSDKLSDWIKGPWWNYRYTKPAFSQASEKD